MKSKLLRTLKKKKEVLLEKLSKLRTYIRTAWANTTASEMARSRFFLAGIALVISLILWGFVTWDGNIEGTRMVEVPIQYTNLTRGFTIYDSDKSVQVRILGRVNMLSRVEISDFRAEVDLQTLQTGKYKLPIKIEVPPYLRVRSWDPPIASVEIYRKIERTLPVAWKIEGKLEAGKIVAGVEISPNEVTLAGPEVDVLAVQALEVTVPINKLAGESPIKLPVKVADASSINDKMLISPGSVNVKVMLEDEIVGEQIPVKVDVVGEPAEGLEIDEIKIIPERITIRGSGEAVRKMNSLTLSPIDVSGLDQNLQLILPLQADESSHGVEIVGSDRARVEITVRKKMVAKTFSVPIKIFGGASGVEWSVIPVAVTLTVEGSQAMMDSLPNGEAPCELYVDVSNIVAGQISLPVLARKLQKDFGIVHIEPEQVIVTRIKSE